MQEHNPKQWFPWSPLLNFGFVFPDCSHKTSICSGHTSETFYTSGFLLTSPVFPRIAMETYIRQRQLIMSPLITSHVIGENEPLTSVLNKVIAAKEVNHKGQGLWVSLKLLPGDLTQVQKNFSHLVDRSTAIARKMGFPEIILPGDVRNDIYVTLIHGEFDKGKKKTPKNVEVTMSVFDEEGNLLEVRSIPDKSHRLTPALW